MNRGGSARDDLRRAAFLVTTTKPLGANEASSIRHAADAAGVAFAMARRSVLHAAVRHHRTDGRTIPD